MKKNRPIPLVLSLLLVSLRLLSQQTDTSRLSLLFAGDIMGHSEQINGALDTISGTYNYEPTFRFIAPLIKKADLAIANLEVTLAGPPFVGYPQFSSPDALAQAAINAGFDVLIQANNHALDRGKAGFLRTIHVLDSLGVMHIGTFSDSTDRSKRYPLIIERNNIRLALLNYTYGTNGLVISKPCIINRIDTAVIGADLKKARQLHPDFVIVTLHWGEEYQRDENDWQKQIATYILHHGANAIIGSHPHVIQPIVVTYNPDSTVHNLVVYSLGNFVSNQRAQYKDGGILFGISLEKTDSVTRISHFGYMPTWVYRQDLRGRSIFYIIPVNLYEQHPDLIELGAADKAKLARFAADTREHLQNIPEIKEITGDK